jgi:putative hydrolase of the HAD superfamily
MPLVKIVLSLLVPIETESSLVKPKLRKLPGIRAVIFDVYGTLFTTKATARFRMEPSVEADVAIVEALEESDFDVFRRDLSLSRLYLDHVMAHFDIRRAEGIVHPEVNISDVWQDFLNELFADGAIDGDLTERSIQRVIIRHECKVNPVWPAKESLEFIRNLQDNDICSGVIATAQFYTPIIMEALYQNSLETVGFRRPICVWSYEHRHRKPSMVLFKLCEEGLRVLGIKPTEALYVGNNMANDIIPASRCGFRTALFTGNAGSAHPEEEGARDMEVKPTIVFNKFSQLEGCIL